MIIDWQSSESLVLFNPSILTASQDKIRGQLLSFKNLSCHFWVATSGSSAEPKWVALSKEAILHSAKAVNNHLQASSKDSWLLALPDFHVGGLGVLARAYLAGSSLIDYKSHFGSKWNCVSFHRLAKESFATLTSLVPAQVYDLVLHALKAPSSLRAVIVGGGRMDQELYLKARELGWNLLPSYGLTECASQVATAKLETLQENQFPRVSILPHIVAEISEEGFLKIKSPSLLSGYAVEREGLFYFDDPKEQEWFLTEDKAFIENGFLGVLGRGRSFVKIGGESVNMIALESLLEKLKMTLKVKVDAAVVAVADDRLGSVIHLVTDGKKQDVEQLVFLYQSHVMPFERIRKIHEKVSIPKSPLNKILHQNLLHLLMSK